MATLLLGTTSMTSQLASLSFSNSVSSPLSLSSPISLSTASVATSSSPAIPLIYCGRGDRKTAKGKRFAHSFGNARPRNKKMGRGPPKAPVNSEAAKKDPFETEEKVQIEVDDE